MGYWKRLNVVKALVFLEAGLAGAYSLVMKVQF